MKKPKNVREIALDMLLSIEKQQAYSNLLLNQMIQKHKITGPDVGLLTEIVYGTLQRKLTLEYYLQPFLKKKVETWVLSLLNLSLYQMIYLDKIPDRAVIYEAVEIAKRRGHKGIASMVNGILRSVQRQGIKSLDEITDPLERLSIETSHPIWLIKRWVKQFGFEKTEQMCHENLHAPVQTVRVNQLKATREEVMWMLENEGFQVQKSPIIPHSIRILQGNVVHSQAFKQGYITIQDESSMVVAYTLQLSSEMEVLDACAAPGGKTGHIAELLQNTGKVMALDLHKHKTQLILENTKRLGLSNVEVMQMDSRLAGEKFQHASFDRILVDAPCSGLGVLRRKPDIKYSKTEEDLYALQDIQLKILSSVAPLVKTDGLLVYSTCTVDQEENVGTVQAFLEIHEEFELHPLQLPEALQGFSQSESYLQIFPQDFGGDGFFIACFHKKN